MTIPAAPAVPVPTSSTFAADAYAFTQWQATLGPAIDAETQRLNNLSFGSYNTTSTTSLTIGTGSKSLTVEAGKGYAIGQALLIASTASPTNYMVGQVTSYNSGTGALVVNVTSVAGSGTVAAWTVSVAAVVAGGGVSPDSIVVLTSGTSWTCPAGVTKAKLRIGGAGSGAKGGNGTIGYGTGAAGGYVEAIIILTPSVVYTYSIGAGGAGGIAAGGSHGGNGGSTTFTVGGITYEAGGGQSYYTNIGGTASGTGALLIPGSPGHAGGSQNIPGAFNALGCFGGESSTANATGDAGDAGKIVLELYK